MTVVQQTDLESLATALLERVDGLVESNTKLQSEVHSLQADLQAAQARLDRHGALARLGEMAAGIARLQMGAATMRASLALPPGTT